MFMILKKDLINYLILSNKGNIYQATPAFEKGVNHCQKRSK